VVIASRIPAVDITIAEARASKAAIVDIAFRVN
jgi:hypothetical protein